MVAQYFDDYTILSSRSYFILYCIVRHSKFRSSISFDSTFYQLAAVYNVNI